MKTNTRIISLGETIKFTLAVGADGVWVSKVEILRPDNSWLEVLEFRMKRIAPAGPSGGAKFELDSFRDARL